MMVFRLVATEDLGSGDNQGLPRSTNDVPTDKSTPLYIGLVEKVMTLFQI